MSPPDDSLTQKESPTAVPCQTWSLTKALVKKLEKKKGERAMERKLLNVELKESEHHQQARNQDDRHTEYVIKAKRQWAGHFARMNDKAWTIRC